MSARINNPAFILDCTCRDGSYVNGGFEPTDTYIIAKALDEAGIPFIEVGPGMGLGSTPSLENEENAIQAAAEAVKNNKWGTFFIPGIGSNRHIDIAHGYQMDFIRIGVEADAWDKSLPYIGKAKACDMYVCVNIMKTHLATPLDISEIADEVYKRGADCIYIVDSAGCMLPYEVEEYISAIKNVQPGIQIGFHGHNNRQLAVFNTMMAYTAGATMLDTTLKGIGRSAGNAITEAFLINMQELGLCKDINLHTLLEVSEKYIDPILAAHPQITNQSLICGKAKIHSSDIDMIEQYAEEWGVNKYTFAENVGKMASSTNQSRVNMEMLKSVHSFMLTCK